VFPQWAWSGSREQFLHCGLRKFRHSKSSVYRWYPQLVHGRFVYETYRTMEATRSHHGWVHMFITHRPTVTLQLHNFDLFRTCLTSNSVLLRGNWQHFNWHDASRSPSAIAERLVSPWYATLAQHMPVQFLSDLSMEYWLVMTSQYSMEMSEWTELVLAQSPLSAFPPQWN